MGIHPGKERQVVSVRVGMVIREGVGLVDAGAGAGGVLGPYECRPAETRLRVPSNRVTGILNRQRAVTGDTALRLGHVFGTSPEFWLNRQSLYELRLAEQRAGKTIKALPRLKRRKGRDARQPAHA